MIKEARMPPPGKPDGDGTGSPLIALDFCRPDLGPLRRRVASCAAQAGLRGMRLQAFVVAVNEIITNAVIHGGGLGRLRLWLAGRELICEVTDGGPGIPGGRVPAAQPPADATSGRGLWLTRALCDAFSLQTGRNGTTIRVASAVDGLSVAAVDPL
jgi:anti-sigma regulatory factor (Ser/Thr protein kinase)